MLKATKSDPLPRYSFFKLQFEVSKGIILLFLSKNSNGYRNPMFSKDLPLRFHAENLSPSDQETYYKMNAEGVSCLPPPWFFCTIFQNQEMGVPTRQNDVLKVVHPGRRVEVFREPIIAGELMRKYPRHCIARPDVFEFPWIAVHPESVLPPGKVFFLVPYHTIYILLKDRRQQQQYLVSSKHKQPSKLSFLCLNYNMHNSPIKSLAGVTPEHLHYKLKFCKFWNKMRRDLNQAGESHSYELDLPVDSSRPCFNTLRNGRPCVTSPEQIELLRLKPCLRKPDSVRKKLNLRVTFACPVAVLSIPTGPPQQDAQVLQV